MAEAAVCYRPKSPVASFRERSACRLLRSDIPLVTETSMPVAIAPAASNQNVIWNQFEGWSEQTFALGADFCTFAGVSVT